MKKILVSLDLRNEFSPLVQQAAALAKAFAAEVVVVTVPQNNGEAAARLQVVATELIDDGVDASAELLAGEPGKAVVAKAQELDADVIVIGSHGNSSVFDVLSGSAGQDIMQHAGRPVLLVPVPKND